MSVIRLYFDADSMERAVVSGLRARGIDATSALEVGMAAQQRYSIGQRIRRLQKLMAARSAEEMSDRVEFLRDWG